jgi:hypothetical protein
MVPSTLLMPFIFTVMPGNKANESIRSRVGQGRGHWRAEFSTGYGCVDAEGKADATSLGGRAGKAFVAQIS